MILSSFLVGVDEDVDDAVFEKDEYDNAASCCLDEKIDLDNQDEDNESSFRLCEYDYVWPNDHL